MNLYERLVRESMEARRRRDDLVLSTLGLLKSELVKATKEPGGPQEIDDALVHRIAFKELKRREEAAEAFAGAGRVESADRERAEAEVLRTFLPPRLTPEELEKEIAAIIAELQPEGPRGFGLVMKEASGRLAGRTEGGAIANVVRRLLG